MGDTQAMELPTMLGSGEALYGVELGPGAMVGAYVIEEMRSRGGYGIVYRATGPAGEPAAVKVLHAALVESPSALQRFQQEVEVIRRIQHPGIVQIFDCGDLTDGRPYLAMEWLDGRTLDEVLRRGPVDLATALSVVEGLGAALSAVHAAGVVHRDIKDSNVMLLTGPDGERRVKLLDFGIAKWVDRDTKLTGTGARVGTPSAMAPEQILGRRIGPATDVYALGVLLFQMLTGRLPFSGDSTLEIEVMHLNAPPPRASDVAAIPDAVSDVIQRCLAKSPAERYASAEELVEDLRAAIADPDQRGLAFRVQPAHAVGIAVGWAEDEDADAVAPALSAARLDCEAEGWTTAWAGERSFLAAAVLPARGEGALGLRARALRLASSLAQRAEAGQRPPSVRVHAARVVLLYVQGMPQIVGGELLEMADAPAGPAGQVLVTEALAGLGAPFAVDPGPPAPSRR